MTPKNVQNDSKTIFFLKNQNFKNFWKFWKKYEKYLKICQNYAKNVQIDPKNDFFEKNQKFKKISPKWQIDPIFCQNVKKWPYIDNIMNMR